MNRQIRRKFARNPDNQKIFDAKYYAQGELQFMVNWAVTWKTCDCQLLCWRISEHDYQLSFTAKKGSCSFESIYNVPADQMEFLMEASFPVNKERELENNFKIKRKASAERMGISESDKQNAIVIDFESKHNLELK